MNFATNQVLTKERLDHVVEIVKEALSDPTTRGMGQRAVQGYVWHRYPIISSVLGELRAVEEDVRRSILSQTSQLVYQFHSVAAEATLARAGLLSDPRIHEGSSLEHKESLDILCLDAKERLYIILKVRSRYRFTHFSILFYSRTESPPLGLSSI